MATGRNTPITSFLTLGFIRLALLIGLIILLYNLLWLPAIIVLFLLVITESTYWWSKLGSRKLSVTKKVSPKRVFQGQEAKIEIQIANKKFLPSIVEYKQPLATGLSGNVSKTLVLGINSNYIDAFQIEGLQRGYYVLEPLILHSRDGLGLYYSQLNLSETQDFFVYPKLIPLADLSIKAGDLIGEKRDNRHILPDPLRTAGLRDYSPEMPARLIHWKASINQDQLLARLIEPSADHKLLFAIDIEGFFHEGNVEEFEKSLSVAATLIVWADENRIPFGLVINASQKGLSGAISIPIGQGPRQTLLALEKLARAEFSVLGSLPDLLEKESKSIPWGTSLLVLGTDEILSKPPGIRHTLYYPCS